MKKILLCLIICTYYSSNAQAPAKQSHDSLLNEIKYMHNFKGLSSENLEVLENSLQQADQTAAELKRTLHEFETKSERELALKKREASLLEKKLKKERVQYVHNKDQQERLLTNSIIQTEKALNVLLTNRESDIAKFDQKIERQLQKQLNICTQLENKINKERELLAQNLAQTEEQLEKAHSRYIQAEKRTIEEYNSYYDQFSNIKNYLAQNEALLKMEAQTILKTYKNKRKSSERSQIINTNLTNYIEQLNTILSPLNNVPHAALQTNKGRELINTIWKNINPVFVTLQELFNVEADRLKQIPMKNMQSERLNALYNCIKQPLKTVSTANAKLHKNISQMDDIFTKLGLSSPK